MACARLVDECARSPAATSAPRPRRARCARRLRTAWKATCGSSAHAWTHRSPPLRAGSSSSPGSGRQRRREGAAARLCGPARSARRTARARARRSPSAAPAARPERLAGVVRRRQRLAVDVARPGGRRSSRSRRRRPRAQQLAQVAARTSVVDVEGGEVQPVLRGRGDARLVAPVERRRSASARRARRRRSRLAAQRVARRRAAAATPPPPARREQRRGASARHRYARAAPAPAPARAARPARRSRCASRRDLGRAARCRARSRRARCACGRSAASTSAEAPLDLGHQRGVACAPSAGRSASNAARAPVDVGLEVEQVDVRVALLLAGDLRLRDLAEQLVGAVGDLRGLELDGAHEPLQSARRRPAAWRRAARCPSSCSATQSACSIGWKPVHCERGDVVGARVDARVEVAEALGDRLDRARRARASAA